MSTTWREGSTAWRTSPRPRGWKELKDRTHVRDGWRCTWTLPDGSRCPYFAPDGRGLECDHVGDPTDHRLANLTTLCGRGTPANHHGTKTSRAGVSARPLRQRPPDTHPGLKPPPEEP